MTGHNELLFPLLGMVFLVFLVWVWMYVTRILSVTVGSLRVQDYAIHDTAKPRMVMLAGDCFENQFELPTLFYCVVVLVLVLGIDTSPYLFAAWGFVLFRWVHAAIHLSYNRVFHRLLAYWAGAIFLWYLWLRFFFDLV
ncbi:MAG: MAPEG family protein [Gammaproteobacteria bacterium]|nr:MAPEG family protein [Gammaproteobacteria bacterium]